MKHSLALLLSALLLVSALAGCGAKPEESDASSAVGSSQPAPIPVPSELPALPPEPPILDWVKDAAVPGFLEPELQDLYLRAYSAAQFLVGPSTSIVEDFPLADGTYLDMTKMNNHQTVEMNGYDYEISVGRYSRWDDFQAMLDGLFTPAFQQQILYANPTQPEHNPPLFTSGEDGEMCFLSASRGANIFYEFADQPDEFELLTRTDDTIEFNLIGHYVDYVTNEKGEEVPGEPYTESFPIRMELTGDGWRFAQFQLPY